MEGTVIAWVLSLEILIPYYNINYTCTVTGIIFCCALTKYWCYTYKHTEQQYNNHINKHCALCTLQYVKINYGDRE